MFNINSSIILGAVVSALNTGNIVTEKLVDTLSNHLADSNMNTDNLLEAFEQRFDENVKKAREN